MELTRGDEDRLAGGEASDGWATGDGERTAAAPALSLRDESAGLAGESTGGCAGEDCELVTSLVHT